MKSTHDEATWAEKRGTHSVNHDGNPSLMLEEVAQVQGQTQNQGLPQNSVCGILHSWPVLKSTHDEALWSEKHGSHSVNHTEGCSDTLDELAQSQGQGQGQGRRGGAGRRGPQRTRREGGRWRGDRQQSQGQEDATEIISSWQELATSPAQTEQCCDTQPGEQTQGSSTILHSWPVLKSTHDQATIAEKRGPIAVNSSGASAVLEEIAQDQGQSSVQAGGGPATSPTSQGSSLQTGLDTQAACHVQPENGNMDEIKNIFQEEDMM